MHTFINSRQKTLEEHKKKKIMIVKFEGWDQVDVVPTAWVREPIASGEVKVMYPVDLTDTNKILKLVRKCAPVTAEKFVTYFVTVLASTSKCVRICRSVCMVCCGVCAKICNYRGVVFM